jgi:hypothetical protein
MSKTVYVSRDNHTQVYHTAEDCQTLQQARDYRAVAKDAVDGTHRECRYGDCGGSDDKDNVYDTACPHCGDTVAKNALRHHLPCDGTDSEVVGDD